MDNLLTKTQAFSTNKEGVIAKYDCKRSYLLPGLGESGGGGQRGCL
jgi:hypothetical protein